MNNQDLSKYDDVYDRLLLMIEDDEFNKINQHLELLKTETDRGILRTALMVLKPFRNEEEIKDNYNQVADILRSGSTHGKI
jgi:hypothetical protein